MWLCIAFILQRYRGYHSHGLLQLCNNLDLAVREAIAFLIFNNSNFITCQVQ
nr:MAG TPA: hypothetical protein [Caudoviricetes sp.]